MATAVPQPTSPGKRKSDSLQIDMTPMVDLGFLLITFFVFTAALSQPRVTKLIMPKEGDPTPVPESKTLTLLLHSGTVFAYEGRWEEALAQQAVIATDYHVQKGVGEVIRRKKAQAEEQVVVMIKPLPSASYQEVLAALDEMQINNLSRYAVVDASTSEILYAQKRSGYSY